MNTPTVTEITEILNMPRGARITYHVGHLAIDAAAHVVEHHTIASRTKAERDAIRDTAIIAMRLSDEGKVSLTQRRLGEHRFEYLAERR